MSSSTAVLPGGYKGFKGRSSSAFSFTTDTPFRLASSKALAAVEEALNLAHQDLADVDNGLYVDNEEVITIKKTTSLNVSPQRFERKEGTSKSTNRSSKSNVIVSTPTLGSQQNIGGIANQVDSSSSSLFPSSLSHSSVGFKQSQKSISRSIEAVESGLEIPEDLIDDDDNDEQKNETTLTSNAQMLWNKVRNTVLLYSSAGVATSTITHGILSAARLPHNWAIRCVAYNEIDDKFAVVNTKGIQIWKHTHKYENINCQEVSILFHIKEHNIYIGSSSDNVIRVFGKDLNLHSTISSSSPVLCARYNATTDEVVTGCVGSILIWGIRHENRRFDESLSRLYLRRTITNNITRDMWISDIHLIRGGQCFAVWDTSLMTFDLESGMQTGIMRNIHTRPITCTIYFPKFQYCVTASKNGSIKMWDSCQNSVFQFVGHTKSVTSLAVYPQARDLLLSASLDCSIRVWNIETLDELYRVGTRDPLESLVVLGPNRFYTVSQKVVEIWDLAHYHFLWTVISSRLVKLYRSWHPSVPTRIVGISDDSSVRLFSPLTGKIITSVLPCLGSEALLDVAYASFDDLIFVLMRNGDICVHRSNSNPCVLLEVWKPADIAGGSRKAKENCTCLCIYEYIVEEKTTPNTPSGNGWSGLIDSIKVKLAENRHSKTLLVGGTRTGQLIIYNFGEHGKIEERIQAHTGAITMMCGNSENERLFSAGTDSCVRMWRVNPFNAPHNTLAVMRTIKCESKPSCLSPSSVVLALAMNNYNMIVYSLVDKAKSWSQSIDDRHTGTITGVAASEELNIFTSVSLDGLVKIWDRENCLLREIQLREPIYSIAFINSDGDIALGIHNHLHCIYFREIMPKAIINRFYTLRGGKTQNISDRKEMEDAPIAFDPNVEFWSIQKDYTTTKDPNGVYASLQDLSEHEPAEAVDVSEHERRAALAEKERMLHSKDLAYQLDREHFARKQKYGSKESSISQGSTKFLRLMKVSSPTGSSEEDSSKEIESDEETHDEIGSVSSLLSHLTDQEKEQLPTISSYLKEKMELELKLAPDGYVPNSQVSEYIQTFLKKRKSKQKIVFRPRGLTDKQQRDAAKKADESPPATKKKHKWKPLGKDKEATRLDLYMELAKGGEKVVQDHEDVPISAPPASAKAPSQKRPVKRAITPKLENPKAPPPIRERSRSPVPDICSQFREAPWYPSERKWKHSLEGFLGKVLEKYEKEKELSVRTDILQAVLTIQENDRDGLLSHPKILQGFISKSEEYLELLQAEKVDTAENKDFRVIVSKLFAELGVAQDSIIEHLIVQDILSSDGCVKETMSTTLASLGVDNPQELSQKLEGMYDEDGKFIGDTAPNTTASPEPSNMSDWMNTLKLRAVRQRTMVTDSPRASRGKTEYVSPLNLNMEWGTIDKNDIKTVSPTKAASSLLNIGASGRSSGELISRISKSREKEYTPPEVHEYTGFPSEYRDKIPSRSKSHSSATSSEDKSDTRAISSPATTLDTRTIRTTSGKKKKRSRGSPGSRKTPTTPDRGSVHDEDVFSLVPDELSQLSEDPSLVEVLNLYMVAEKVKTQRQLDSAASMITDNSSTPMEEEPEPKPPYNTKRAVIVFPAMLERSCLRLGRTHSSACHYDRESGSGCRLPTLVNSQLGRTVPDVGAITGRSAVYVTLRPSTVSFYENYEEVGDNARRDVTSYLKYFALDPDLQL